ncbi:hypothetical protein MP228_009780 [Amoeboaphelidium protococcarum]|nr:hypothetical protein MP228_009780 [Amoeboaphelidium protococcarum]
MPEKQMEQQKTKSDDYPLPAGWRKAVSSAHNQKAYFINDVTKETSWVDPRDALWKPKTWQKCKGDEVPYGWEIAYDEAVGRYFIDHLNKRNLLDDPRDNKPKEQLKQVQQHIESATSVIQSKQKTLRLKKDELAKFKQQMMKEQNIASSDPTDEVIQLQNDIEQSSQAVDAIKQVIQDLELDQTDQLTRQKQILEKIDQLKQDLEEQARVRAGLEEHLTEMKQNFEHSKQDDAALEQAMASATEVITGTIRIKKQKQTPSSEANTSTQSMKQQTRIEREFELLSLQKQLQIEQDEIARLKEIAQRAKAEIAKALAMPYDQRQAGKKQLWIQLMIENANKSQTIRFNMKQKYNSAVDAGDVLNFREKMLFFTSNPLQK